MLQPILDAVKDKLIRLETSIASLNDLTAASVVKSEFLVLRSLNRNLASMPVDIKSTSLSSRLVRILDAMNELLKRIDRSLLAFRNLDQFASSPAIKVDARFNELAVLVKHTRKSSRPSVIVEYLLHHLLRGNTKFTENLVQHRLLLRLLSSGKRTTFLCTWQK